MQTYSEIKYKLYGILISLVKKDTVVVKKKTMFGESTEAIPLVAFSPEWKVVKKGISTLMKLVFGVEVIAILGLAFLYSQYYAYFSMGESIFTFAILGFFPAVSIAYYFSVTKKRLNFYSNAQQIIITLQPTERALEWAKVFSKKVIAARLHFDKDNFIKLSKGIDNLEKQGLINNSFAEELHERLNEIASTNIK